MVTNDKKKLVFTIIAISVMGMITGLFLRGGLLPSQASYEQYDERVTTSTKTTVLGHSHDDLSIHAHNTTTVVTVTETTPHGYFHVFDTMMASGITPTPTESIPVPGPNEVWVPGKEFRPSILIVPVGTTVTWTNKEGEEHTVTSETRLFDGSLRPFGSFSYTFTERGTFEYHCDPHREMTAKVIVK